MTRRITSNLPFVLVVAVAFAGSSARESLAGGETCVTCGATRICLEWSQGDPPLEDVNFAVDCTVPATPDIELITGDLEWRIDSWDTEIFEPGHLGTLTIDPSSGAMGLRLGAGGRFRRRAGRVWSTLRSRHPLLLLPEKKGDGSL